MATTASAVRQVELPRDARALSTLGRIDYEDAFQFDTGADRERTAEEWAREVLEGAPHHTRAMLRTGWLALGLQLDCAPTEHRILGWEVRRRSPDHVLLGANSRVGLRGELLLQRRDGTLLFATVVCHENPAARTVWAATTAMHQQIVRRLLERVAP